MTPPGAFSGSLAWRKRANCQPGRIVPDPTGLVESRTGGARLPNMQSELEAEPVPLSIRATGRRKWPSAPPPAMPVAPKRSLLSITLIGAVWIAVGAASAAYVVSRTHNAQPNMATTDVAPSEADSSEAAR